jgi:catechol 2,3-dioxygenase
MGYTVGHFEVRARDQAVMEKFYREVLGFIVSDRGVLDRGPMRGRELIFMSHSPEEHHQIVLIPTEATAQSSSMGSGIGHVAFRVDSLDEVRRVYEKVRVLPYAKPEPVSHGNT